LRLAYIGVAHLVSQAQSRKAVENLVRHRGVVVA
jgi:hypothetical protein